MSVEDVMYAGWSPGLRYAGPSFWQARALAKQGRACAEQAWREAEHVERRSPACTALHDYDAFRRGFTLGAQARDLFALSALAALSWLWGHQ